MTDQKFALSTHFFGNRTLEPDLFRLVRDYGIEAVEMWGMDPQIDVSDPGEVARVARWLEKAGVRCASLHAPFWIDIYKPSFEWLSLAHPNERIRAISVERALCAIDAAVALGADIVVVHGIGEFSKDSLDAAERRFRESMDKLVPKAEAAGVRLAIENIITPHSRVRFVRRFVERLGNRHVGICVDVGHAFIDDDPKRALDAAMPYLFEVHIADNKGSEDDHLIPGEGRIDWDPVWSRLKSCSSLEVATFEVMPVCIAGEYSMEAFEARLASVAQAMEEARARVNG